MAIEHVRAKCKTTGHVAALSERALDLGLFSGWERVDGPVPARPKAAATKAVKKTDDADGESANQKEE